MLQNIEGKIRKNKTSANLQDKLLSFLPIVLADEISRIGLGRRGGIASMRQLTLRADGLCVADFGGEKIRLMSGISQDELNRLLLRLCEGALYAHRHSICQGYVSAFGGIRVGVCGRASYDGEMVGVSEYSALVIRIPTGVCSFSEELCQIYMSEVTAGMLIFAPPGGGKTTALRSLASSLGSVAIAKHVVVVDERLEFTPDDYRRCDVDILRGYSRCRGIEIATRTLGADVVIIDEIGADDANMILQASRFGIPMVATVHASSFNEVMAKPSIQRLLDTKAFNVAVGIGHSRDGYCLTKHSF